MFHRIQTGWHKQYFEICESLEEPDLSLMNDAALAKLAKRTQQAYLLNRHKKLTYGKIAETMGVFIKTGQAHIWRKIVFLRKDLVVYYAG